MVRRTENETTKRLKRPWLFYFGVHMRCAVCASLHFNGCCRAFSQAGFLRRYADFRILLAAINPNDTLRPDLFPLGMEQGKQFFKAILVHLCSNYRFVLDRTPRLQTNVVSLRQS